MQNLRRYERLPENKDGERRDFFRGEQISDVINGTELRAVGVDVIAGYLGSSPDPAKSVFFSSRLLEIYHEANDISNAFIF